MILKLKNIAKIKEATVEINGITVIAGANNTGKSTVGKALYSVFNSFYKIEQQIRQERQDSIEGNLYFLQRNIDSKISRKNATDLAAEIVGNMDNLQTLEDVKDRILENIAQTIGVDSIADQEHFNRRVLGLYDILQIQDEDIFQRMLLRKLNIEFDGQINNIFTNDQGMIELVIKKEAVNISLAENELLDIQGKFDLSTEAVYIDDPFVLDANIPFRYPSGILRGYDHRSHLQYKLFAQEFASNLVNEILTTNRLENIFSKLNSVCSGEMVEQKRSGFGYRRQGTDKVLNIKNISTGLKTFVIIKTLLQKGVLTDNGTIILDEPEIHLHPEWQLLFAEIIVLLQQEFGMHILLNTHSPYFLHAIEVYATKYGVADKCKYYMADLDGDVAIIKDVSENIDLIYQKLAKPLQDLEDEKYRDA